MGAVKPLDKEMTHYWDHLSTKKKKAVLTLIKTFAEEEEIDLWEDKAFVAEMDKRYTELKTGKVKGISFDELATRTRQAFKERKDNEQ